MNWAEAIDAVATALADAQLSAENGASQSRSLLAAVSASTPPSLRSRLQHLPAMANAPNGDIEPQIYQNELPIRLLASGIVGVSAQAVARMPVGPASAGDNAQDRSRITAIVALAALSTLRLDLADEDTTLAHVRRRASELTTPGWVQALDSVSCQTAELTEFLSKTAADRRQIWQHVTLEDRILAEAVAAAVVSGVASTSGLLPQQWLFPFHLFCGLAVSAAKASLETIERWLGIEFLPAPRTAERTASLAVLVANEAGSLWRGCGCKVGIDASDVAYSPRGSCRQADHDLRAWRPGQPKPGSSKGAHYATTLWGWQRRWLGGANAGGAAPDRYPERPRPRANDVASSVLARTWLSADRGFGGPVLLYDRILPEFCLSCGTKIQPISVSGADGRTLIQRAACCEHQQLVYRSEFSWRHGERILKPKLGIIVTSLSEDGGNAGYCTTAPLGPLWLCRSSGRYSLSERYCPSPECGSGQACIREPAHHGWVLLPLADDAWADLKATGSSADEETISSLDRCTVGEPDLRLLADICSQVLPGTQCEFETPADVWKLAAGWSSVEMRRFMPLGGQHGLELLLLCKSITEAQTGPKATQVGVLNSRPATDRKYDQEIAPGSERIDRDD